MKSETTADVVIIGSGAGELAEAGLQVLVVKAGSHKSWQDHLEWTRGQLWKYASKCIPALAGWSRVYGPPTRSLREHSRRRA